MGRTMPTECEHGTTVDWGDFGPCQDCSEHELGDCPNIVECEQCATARAKVRRTFPSIILGRGQWIEVVKGLRKSGTKQHAALADRIERRIDG